MNHRFNCLIVVISAFFLSVLCVSAQERPKLRELSDRKVRIASDGLYPLEKKGKWGFVDSEGKFVIRPIFSKVMPMCAKQTAFVAYVNETGKQVWTPINYMGLYLTESEFDEVVVDYDAAGLAVVKIGDSFGVVDYMGKMAVECIGTMYLERGPVLMVRTPSDQWKVVARDASYQGYSVYDFELSSPIVVKAKGGYGIISPHDQSIVADFVYDAVQEYVRDSIYVLRKGNKKYLYADDRLSDPYDDVIPGVDNSYFVIMNSGRYGVLSSSNDCLLSCTQTYMPKLKGAEYLRFYEGDKLIYVNVESRLSVSEYDDYLYEKYSISPSAYVLDNTLNANSKKYVADAISNSYGTADFKRLMNVPQAVEYAEGRKLVLLSNDDSNAMLLDIETGRLRKINDVLYHSFPSDQGVPRYATALRNGKFGIIDIRNCDVILPFSYDKITPLDDSYALLHVRNAVDSIGVQEALYLYDVQAAQLVCSEAFESVTSIPSNFQVTANGKVRLFNTNKGDWLFPEGYTLCNTLQIPSPAWRGIVKHAGAIKNDYMTSIVYLSHGDKLAECLVDDVDDSLFAGKYLKVTVDGKKGLFNLKTSKYALRCMFDDILDYFSYCGSEIVHAMRDGRYLFYDMTNDKAILDSRYNSLSYKDGYIVVSNNSKFGIYSLLEDKMVIPETAEYIKLLENRYALVISPSRSGIYSLDDKKWHVDFGRCSYDDFSMGDFVDMGDNILFVPQRGILDYEAGKWLKRDDMDWALWCSRSGDYIGYAGGFESETKAVYSITQNEVIMEYDATYKMDVISSQVDTCLNSDYILFASYGDSAGGGRDESLGEYVSPSWLPWNDQDGGAGLYDIKEDKWILTNERDIAYIGAGLLGVSGKGIYDLSLGQWIVEDDDALYAELVSQGMEDSCLFIGTPQNNDTSEYLFDIDSRVLAPLSDTFSVEDYKRLRRVNNDPRFNVKLLGNQWQICDSLMGENIHYGYDRIAFMWESPIKVSFRNYVYANEVAFFPGSKSVYSFCYDVDLPERGYPESVMQVMRRNILSLVFGTQLANQGWDSIVADYTSSLVADWRYNCEDYFNDYGEPYLTDQNYIKGRMLEPYNGIVSYVYDIYGPGYNASKIYINMDINTGAVVSQSDLFEPGCRQTLEQMLTEFLPEHIKANVISLEREIHLPEYFYITESGVTFMFPQGEIGCMADGVVEVTLPWDNLDSLLVK